MSNLDIIRAWKDEEYRMGLSEDQRKLLPEHPAGLVELVDTDLNIVAGGRKPLPNTTKAGGCPPPYTRLPNICGNTFDCNLGVGIRVIG
jgi:mersacidin/lichenicidin family type 2 lantibiotic